MDRVEGGGAAVGRRLDRAPREQHQAAGRDELIGATVGQGEGGRTLFGAKGFVRAGLGGAGGRRRGKGERGQEGRCQEGCPSGGQRPTLHELSTAISLSVLSAKLSVAFTNGARPRLSPFGAGQLALTKPRRLPPER